MRTHHRTLVLLAALGIAAGPALVPTAAQAAGTAVDEVAVDCSAGSSCTLAWDAVAKPVAVYEGPAPDAIRRATPVAQAQKGATGATVTGLDPAQRHYFEVRTGRGAGTIAADRSLHLASAPNFRDIGGYETADGHTVQWGKVYRSDALSKLSDEEFAHVSDLGIKVVCDFRGPSEVTADGQDRLPAGAEYVALPIFDPANDQNAAIRSAIISGDRAQQEAVFGGGRAAQVLIDGGRAMVTNESYRKQLGAALQRLAEPAALPTVLHCTAGKDRTGWATAVVLTMLGVPRETVLADYLATNDYLKTLNATRIAQVSALLYDPELLRPLLEAREEYLQASFDAVEEQYGSFSKYLTKGLGIDRRTQQQIRKNLLTT